MGGTPKALSAVLRSLEEQGEVMQMRPGKWARVGMGGEYPVTVKVNGEVYLAVFADDVERAIKPLHRMGSQDGDKAFAIVADDSDALLTRITSRDGEKVIGTLNFRYGRVTLITDRRRLGEIPVPG